VLGKPTLPAAPASPSDRSPLLSRTHHEASAAVVVQGNRLAGASQDAVVALGPRGCRKPARNQSLGRRLRRRDGDFVGARSACGACFACSRRLNYRASKPRSNPSPWLVAPWFRSTWLLSFLPTMTVVPELGMVWRE